MPGPIAGRLLSSSGVRCVASIRTTYARPRGATNVQTGQEMQIKRRFTAGKSPYEKIPFRRAASEIKNPDGSVVFRLENFAVPEHWSQVAADILAQKYFRKAGVPARLKRVEETQVPSWLWRSVADERALAERPVAERIIGETDARQVFDRLAGTWTLGLEGRLFHQRGRRARLLRRASPHAGHAAGCTEQPAVVQHRPALAYGIDGPGRATFTSITSPVS